MELSMLDQGTYQRYMADLCKMAKIPPRYSRVMVEGKRRPNGDWAAFLEDRRNLYIVGGVGAGKTDLACRIAVGYQMRHATAYGDYFRGGDGILIKNRSVRFTTATNLLSEVKDTYQDGALESERDVMTKYGTCDLLVLDDFGGKEGNVTGWVISSYWQILNYRYENEKPIIITTQYTPDELMAMYSQKEERERDVEATISRLIGEAEPIRLSGGDRRLGGPSGPQGALDLEGYMP